MPPRRILLSCCSACRAGAFRPLPRPTKICWARRRAIRSARAPTGSMTRASGRVVQPRRQDTSALHPGQSHNAAAASTTAAAPKIEYRFENRSCSLDDFLARQRVTGFLVIKDGEVLVERYQYDRNADASLRFAFDGEVDRQPRGRDGAGRKEDRLARRHDRQIRAELAGNPYGETTIRNMLRMASGVPFKEVYDGNDDLAKFAQDPRHAGSIAALRAFTTREAEQGTRFHYASSETVAPGACCCAR